MRYPDCDLLEDVNGMTFREIEAKYGGEVAISAGIAADPDTWELTLEEMAKARPAAEIVSHIAEAYRRGKLGRRTRGKQKAPLKAPVSLRLAPELSSTFTPQAGAGRLASTTHCAGPRSAARGRASTLACAPPPPRPWCTQIALQ